MKRSIKSSRTGKGVVRIAEKNATNKLSDKEKKRNRNGKMITKGKVKQEDNGKHNYFAH